ncbi:MAG: GMC oxidoreductase [Parvularculaceae bacterium]
MFGRKKRAANAFFAGGAERVDASYDVVVIGSGAGGATIARRLAETGKSILILERGPRLPIGVENWDAREVFIRERYKTTEVWRDRKNRKLHPTTHYWVGGNTSFYGSALFRFRKRDFDEVAHCDGVSPAWPISYADLKPYYDEAETIWRVRGDRAGDNADPTDDPDAPQFALPPIEDDPEIAALRADLKSGGWKPFVLPLGIDREDAAPWRGACVRCTTCGGFPCLMRAKSDARAIGGAAEAFANVTVQPDSRVVRLETDGRGREVTGVVYERAGETARVRGDVVVLAAGAVNSAALLLRSANATHPEGLANGSDQVGRNFMFHTLSAVLSTTGAPVKASFSKTLALNDFYWGDPGGGFDYPMGNIQGLEYMNADAIRGQVRAMVPTWAFPKVLANLIARRILAFLAVTEDLPRAKNRVRINRRDEITLDYWYNNLEAHNRLVERFMGKMSELGRMCGCARQHRYQFSELLPLFGVAHQQGTLRMGADPASSVVAAACKAHELDNLYVGDTSVNVSSAAVNPTLTVVANGLRIGDHLIDRLGA